VQGFAVVIQGSEIHLDLIEIVTYLLIFKLKFPNSALRFANGLSLKFPQVPWVATPNVHTYLGAIDAVVKA
jgi:hypothetical protein